MTDNIEGIVNKNNQHFYYFSYFIFFLIPILIYSKYFIKDMALGGSDFVQYFVSQKYVGHEILSGIFPQWNCYLSAGTPQIAISGLYIISLLLSFLPLKIYIYTFFLFHIFLGTISFFYYLKEKGCHYNVAFLMAIIFEISIQLNGYRKGHPSIIAAICLFPLIMFFVKKFLNTEQKRWLYFSAIISAMQTTAFIQYGIYGIIIIFVYIFLFSLIKKYHLKLSASLALCWLLTYLGAISFFFLPVFSVLKEYKIFGSSAIEFSTFSSYSMHPIKLLMILYPLLFGQNVYQALGYMNSSEMDIEIFFGTFAFIMFLIALRCLKNDYTTRVEIVCLILAFFYTCIAHIPIVRYLIFKLPILGGFRCSGRFLYLFNFFYLSLIASALTYFVNNTSDCIKKLMIISGIICIITILLYAIIFVSKWKLNNIPKHDIIWGLKNSFLKPFVFSFMILIISLIVKNRPKFLNNSRLKNNLFFFFFLVSACLEILPFSLRTNSMPISNIYFDDNISQIIRKDSNYKIWDAFPGVDGGHESIISQGKNIIKKVSAINSYITFNNPNLVKYFDNLGKGIDNVPFNLSGLMTGSVSANRIISLKNDFLSMLGIRYIIDSGELIKKASGNIVKSTDSRDKIFEAKTTLISDYYGEVGVNNICVGKFSPNKIYEFEFDYFCDNINDLSYFAIDLYGGKEYDFAEQEFPITINNKKRGHIKGFIFSGNTSEATSPIIMRALIVNSKHVPMLLKNIVIYEKSLALSHAYDFLMKDVNNNDVFLNANACPLIYSPLAIRTVNDWDNLYLSIGEYELDKYAYLKTAEERKIRPAIIKETNIRTNSISSLIDSPEDSYICISQCYSKYWKLKIDGIPQKIDFVNGLIMGCSVPSGLHQVDFYYSNFNYLLGAIITIATVSIIFFFSIKEKRKSL